MDLLDVMTREVVSVTPDMPLREAADLLARRRLRAVPVTDDENHVLGMLTDRLLMLKCLPELEEREGGGSPLASVRGEVRDVMERVVLCVNEDEPLSRVVRLMLDKEIERMPVVRGGRLAGFITRGDIIRRLLQRGTEGEGE